MKSGKTSSVLDPRSKMISTENHRNDFLSKAYRVSSTGKVEAQKCSDQRFLWWIWSNGLGHGPVKAEIPVRFWLSTPTPKKGLQMNKYAKNRDAKTPIGFSDDKENPNYWLDVVRDMWAKLGIDVDSEEIRWIVNYVDKKRKK